MTHALPQAPPLGNEALRQFVNTTDGVYVCASKSTDLVSPLLMARGWQPRFVASVDNSLLFPFLLLAAALPLPLPRTLLHKQKYTHATACH